MRNLENLILSISQRNRIPIDESAIRGLGNRCDKCVYWQELTGLSGNHEDWRQRLAEEKENELGLCCHPTFNYDSSSATPIFRMGWEYTCAWNQSGRENFQVVYENSIFVSDEKYTEPVLERPTQE